MSGTKLTHWFFLRGLARESGHWGPFLSEFERAIPGAKATALDFPGFGSRFTERSPTSIAAMTDALQDEFMRARATEPDREPRLFAVSLGGMVAADWLVRSSSEFTAAVLVNSSFRGWSPLYRRLTAEAMARFVGIALLREPLARERAVLAMVSNRPEIRERVAAEWAELERARPLRIENFFRQIFAASQFAPSETAPPIPVLVLNSVRDRMVHPSCSLEISQRWSAPIRRHPTGGHDLTLDAQDWVLECVRAWSPPS